MTETLFEKPGESDFARIVDDLIENHLERAYRVIVEVEGGSGEGRSARQHSNDR